MTDRNAKPQSHIYILFVCCKSMFCFKLQKKPFSKYTSKFC